MKSLKIGALALVLALALTSCKTKFTKHYNPYSMSELLSKDTQGIVTLRGVSDEKSVAQDAINDSHKKALQKLFYQGFPGTDFKMPMITEGISVESKHKAYFDQFWASGYKILITDNQTEVYDCSSNKVGCYSAASTFKINYNNLRKELEKAGVIRKLGF